MRKLILRTVYSAGDVVMLTAAVRDLHGTYPGQFLTDVRTRCAELWEHNPYVTPLDEADPGVELIECDYPLINRCERAACHCLHGFIEFLNQRLGLAIQCTAFHGDLHLSALEKSWYSQVYELVGRELPFWLVVAGGKYDVTIKWWSTERFQAVVDHFRGRIQFVQVGHPGHHHPRLEGAIDLRGETNPRELVRLVYHAQGVLCPVTAVMHLAAAVEVKGNRPPHRPCVVVAGGREPAPWEAYPFHQFIHTVGSLPCCAQGGCWRDRTLPLGDGDERDGPDRLCLAVRNGLPRCMDLITAAEVIRRIELYFQGGVVRYLTADEAQAARRGVAVTADRRFDQLPLTLSGARLACERFEQRISTYPKRYGGRGIVICAGGVKYFTCAWVCLNMLRRLGCTLPVQLWYLGKEELDDDMRALVAPLGAECVDAHRLRKRWPMRRLGGWELKPYAMVHSPFQEVLFLDADNVPVVNPEYLFETPEYREHGAIFWPDYGQFERTAVVWQSCGLPRPAGPEFESGQLLVDKQRCWRALNLALWFNAHSDFYYQYLHGDKETFHLAFRKTQTPFALVPVPIQPLVGTMCQHDFQGRRVFQHRNTDKWDLFLHNQRVPDFWFEAECRDYVRQLQQAWDGRAGRWQSARPRARRLGSRWHRPPRIAAYLICRPGREALHTDTLRNLARTDWGTEPTRLDLDAGGPAAVPTGDATALSRTFAAGLERGADYLLLLEDDLVFNRFLRHNLDRWPALRAGWVEAGSLYNPSVAETACDLTHCARWVAPARAAGGRALLLSSAAVGRLLDTGASAEHRPGRALVRLTTRLGQPVVYHAPSLARPQGGQGAAVGEIDPSVDFLADWRA